MFTVRSFLVAVGCTIQIAVSWLTPFSHASGVPFKPTSQRELKDAVFSCFVNTGHDSVVELRSIPINSGGEERMMPQLGLGTWQAEPNVVGRAVSFALKTGYRHIDCAAIYRNEKEVGASLAASTVSREGLFVTSKLWNSEHAPENVAPAVKQTLSDLQLGYLDLYLVHWPQAYAKVRGNVRARGRKVEGNRTGEE